MKLYFLIAVFLNDHTEYVLRRHVDLNKCTQALIMERKAYLEVKEKYPEFDVRFYCREETK